MEILLKKTTLQSDICLIAYLSYNILTSLISMMYQYNIYDVSVHDIMVSK